MQVSPVTKVTGMSITVNVSEAVELGAEIEHIFRSTHSAPADYPILYQIFNGLQNKELVSAYEEVRTQDAGSKVGI